MICATTYLGFPVPRSTIGNGPVNSPDFFPRNASVYDGGSESRGNGCKLPFSSLGSWWCDTRESKLVPAFHAASTLSASVFAATTCPESSFQRIKMWLALTSAGLMRSTRMM